VSPTIDVAPVACPLSVVVQQSSRSEPGEARICLLICPFRSQTTPLNCLSTRSNQPLSPPGAHCDTVDLAAFSRLLVSWTCRYLQALYAGAKHDIQFHRAHRLLSFRPSL